MLKTFLSQVLLVAALATLSDTAHAAPPPGMTTFTARLADANGPLTGSHNFAFGLYAAPTGGSALWSETHSSVVLEQGLASIALGGMTPLTTTHFDGSTRYLEVIVDGTALDARVPIHSVPYALRAGVAETAQSAQTAQTAEVANSLSASLEAQLDLVYQAPLVAGCSAGQFLTSFTGAGVASCSADGKGVAAAGGGLSGTANGANIELAIALNAISNAHIINGTILGEDIAANAIDGAKVLDSSLTGADIQNASIDGGDIAGDSIGSSHLLANSVSSSEIVDASITSTELAASACDTAQIATNAVTNVKMADNSIGAAEVINNSLGYDDVDSVMFTSFNPAGVTLASGINDIFVSQTFAATSNGSCLVTAMGRLTNAGASATGGVSLRVIWRTVGGNTVSDSTIAPLAGQYPGAGQTHVTKAHTVSLQGGNTYEFGCRLAAQSDWVGDTGECQVSVFCQ